MPVRRIDGTGFGLWPTPCAMEPHKDLEAFQAKRALARSQRGGGHGPNLATAVAMWPTPCLPNNGGSNGKRKWKEMLWMPTPTVSDNKRGDRMEHCLNNPKAGMNLNTYVRNFPTPSANDFKGSSKAGQRRGQLTDPDMGVIQPGGQLNPPWVEWLMGWPVGWTDLEPLEMDRFRRWPQWHSKS